MPGALLVTVRLHDGRYHGAGDWPPSPARLFQALVAGAGLSGPLRDAESRALAWLERRGWPLVAAPELLATGQSVKAYVPNNDLDAFGGDARRMGKIRTPKMIRPRLLDQSSPLAYAWTLDEPECDEPQARVICALAERLYQFGRGVDMAWAQGELLTDEELEVRLSTYPGRVYRPTGGAGGTPLACPAPGSLASLIARYEAGGRRFQTVGAGNAVRQRFSQPPKPRFAQVAYESPSSLRLYDLRDTSAEPSLAVWPLARAPALVVWLRDGVVHRLRKALPDRGAEIERVLVGRKADGADDGPASTRVRIVPLPSIGHEHADRGIRRVLVEVPAGCSLRSENVHWAFSGLALSDPEAGDRVLTNAGDEGMLGHYGVAGGARFRLWRSVTPVALPEPARRRRIDPSRAAAEAKGGEERAAEQARAAGAVVQALRHAEVRAHPEAIRVQREPFEAKGERAEAFASGTRFAKERLWHVEVALDAPIAGPLVLGDGRFLGLGVMAPVRRCRGIHTFAIEGGLEGTPAPTEMARALRRAVMARVQDALGRSASLPSFFTGHERDGSPARASHSHLTFVFEPRSARLSIVAPHVLDRRVPTKEELDNLASLDAALTGFRELRAGSSGCLTLQASTMDAADPLLAPSRTWESVTLYQVTRHAKHVGAAEALAADLRSECRRCSLSEPRVTARDLRGVPGVGLVGTAQLTFEVAVEGPIVLGRSRHLGGGLFVGTGS